MNFLVKRFILFCLLAISFPLLAQDVVRLATTTSTYNSGLLDYLLPHFEEQHANEVQVLSVGTGQALRLGQDGDVDLVLTHAPEAEAAFVEAGHGIEPKGLMYNDFILLGPPQDQLNLYEARGVLDAFDQIRASNQTFISRGDDSGTHKKELELWNRSGGLPEFSRYQAVGQGMGRTLIMTSELQGYTLADRGTWLAMQEQLELEVVYEGGIDLANPYQVILVNPERHSGINHSGARKLQDWLVSPEAQKLIDRFSVNGEQLFYSDAQ
ncbi:substrate-binding domain-containing protein [Marinospirillum sp.]|uniref:substrate-binding domain-containing protein n=1 Tax=Marinospirillum sp. TaxID=2183934 RepID=UPI003850D877